MVTYARGMGFGGELRQRRKQAKLTQQDLADRMAARGYRVTGSYISMIEREYDKTRKGEPTRVNRDFIAVVAPILEWDMDEALLVAGHAPVNASVTKPPTNLPELIQALSDLGLPIPQLYGGFENLVDDAESFDEAVSRIILDLEMVMKRHRLPPNSNSPRIPEQPIKKRKTGT
jgi:transcriptional regulator with XRE-family HTH domain